MSSLTAVKAAIDLVNWDSVGFSRIKAKMDELLDSVDSDISESEMDESSQSELLYGQLRKLLDEEEVLDEETIKDLAEEEEVELEGELEELLEGDEEDEEEDDIEYEDEDEETSDSESAEIVEKVDEPTTDK